MNMNLFTEKSPRILEKWKIYRVNKQSILMRTCYAVLNPILVGLIYDIDVRKGSTAASPFREFGVYFDEEDSIDKAYFRPGCTADNTSHEAVANQCRSVIESSEISNDRSAPARYTILIRKLANCQCAWQRKKCVPS